MLFRWLPWKFLVGRAARAYGVLDPVRLLARLRSFAQPSEVQEPIELLRAGIIFQARGLINARVIQYNLDWIWPYWVEKQFNPQDPSFVPRSFSFGHVNLTQRSWTAAGHPDLPLYPIVDPHGMVTPLYDGWSLDFWLLQSEGPDILPSKLAHVVQRASFEPDYFIHTRAEVPSARMSSRIRLVQQGAWPLLHILLAGRSERGGRLVASIRPCNPEGISFVEQIAFDHEQLAWNVNRKTLISLDSAPEAVLFSDYRRGDVYHAVSARKGGGPRGVHCPMGLATSAAVFPLEPGKERRVHLIVPLAKELRRTTPRPARHAVRPPEPQSTPCRAVLPDARMQFLYDNAVHTLLMLSAGEIYPGPFTYKRFWFRDGCLMLHPLLCLGRIERARRHLDSFVSLQRKDGYFLSQEGEWDSNGQVLWILERFAQISGEPLPAAWIHAMFKGARWIVAKRLPLDLQGAQAGLLPAGFSAEHLGPNDFYFWDDFWGVAGLRAASHVLQSAGSSAAAAELEQAAQAFLQRVSECIAAIDPALSRGGIPASPYRRMDAGAIGSMVADYPLQLTPPADPRIWATLSHLLENHLVSGGFFQDMIHSGINPYLTLALAQTLLRAGDDRYSELLQAVADLASPTGNWPEAIHPFSGGGCMGDGQHGWAAAEWVMMIRNLFVREEDDCLIIGSGVFPKWLESGSAIEFGPTASAFGTLRVTLQREEQRLHLQVECIWRRRVALEIRVPGFACERIESPEDKITRILPAEGHQGEMSLERLARRP